MSETTFHLELNTTSSPDPWTESGYSVWKQDACAVRRAWLEMMGLSSDEIDEQCASCPPTDLDEELAQYNAMFDIQAMNELAAQQTHCVPLLRALERKLTNGSELLV